MYICKYKGNKLFEVKGSTELIEINYMGNNDVVNYSLVENKNYLVANINKNYVVLPYKIDNLVEDNIDININNQIVLKQDGEININDTIILKTNGDIEISLSPLKKLKINGKPALTNGAIITSPTGPCTITEDGQ